MACQPKSNIIERFTDDGRLIARYEVQHDSIRHGLYRQFDQEGRLFEESTYTNGQLNGERKLHYPDGQVEIVERYAEGIIHGLHETFYENGAVKLKSVYEHGVLTGISRKYYESGALMEEVTFVENEENGPFVEYHPNGQKKWEGQYLNGDNEFGLLVKYDENGQAIRKLMCDSLAVCKTIWEIGSEATNQDG